MDNPAIAQVPQANLIHKITSKVVHQGTIYPQAGKASSGPFPIYPKGTSIKASTACGQTGWKNPWRRLPRAYRSRSSILAPYRLCKKCFPELSPVSRNDE